MKEFYFILNPVSRRGKSRGLLETLRARIAEQFSDAPLRLTAHPGHATELAREAADAGYSKIIAVGGDGTMNEVVNGLMSLPVPTRPALGVVSSGTGGDFFRRLQERYSFPRGLSWIATSQSVPVDVGLAQMGTEANGKPPRRCYFLNIADAGVSGEVVRRVGLSKKRWGALEYPYATLLSAISYQPPRVCVRQDFSDGTSGEYETDLLLAVAANGRYFGGGMCIAPEAELDDGQLDMLIGEKMSYFTLLRQMPRMYAKKKFNHPKVRYGVGTRMILESRNHEIPIGIDGEYFHALRVSFEIVPQAIRVLIPGTSSS